MSDSAQKRALQAYRSRIRDSGRVRFEVTGRPEDRALIRRLAQRLADEGSAAGGLRAIVEEAIGEEPQRIGGIVDALRRSPLVGVDLDVTRSREEGRSVDV